MTRLIRDRYYAYANAHAWDLATGETMTLGDLEDAHANGMPAALTEAEPATLKEVLDHGREGEPRWLT
ncbi:MAG TPA: hypothetical protein VKB50_26370, partial [Vicinamibacterales bacterium]|nr:hypothetical protein [Vicinamibacterales bacterium]